LGVKAYIFIEEVIGGGKPVSSPARPQPAAKEDARPRRRRPAVRVTKARKEGEG